MSLGKYLSLEEARKQNKLKRFTKEHPSEGNEGQFHGILNAMAKKPDKTEFNTQKKPAK